jgi:hypothetical protein
VTIKKLTKNNPTMAGKFLELQQSSPHTPPSSEG